MPGEDHATKPISLFYSYSHKDEELRLKLQDHLAALKWSGMIAEWNDRDIEAGKEWEREIDHHLSSADIILLLVSASFIASPYCWSVEVRKALERHERGEARVIPVILRPCRWQRTPFAKFQATPKDARPVTDWPDEHAAFDDVVSKIEAVVDELRRSVGTAADAMAGGDEPKAGSEGGGSLIKPPQVLTDFSVFRDVDAPWCPEMVALPAGTFLMGSPQSEKERDHNEGPQHRVTIGTRFAIGRYPVTFAEYDQFCDVMKREKPEDNGWGRGRHPVIDVSWHDAQAYVAWLAKETGKHYRLPSEAEWEYGARAGTTKRYAFGNEITERDANFGGNVGKTTEVGAYPANPWGLYDMHGNVLEWVEDIWHDSYQSAPADGLAWTVSEGKNSSRYRVGRGGSWNLNPRNPRSAVRVRGDPESRRPFLGFRVARTLN
jgi:formylglycine-generating enzyme required for sulfatase activity